MEDKDVVTQSGQKANQSTSNCLSDLVKTIHNIFQSAHCVSITKSELVHKIMVNNIMGNNLDIIESGMYNFFISWYNLSAFLFMIIIKGLFF